MGIGITHSAAELVSGAGRAAAAEPRGHARLASANPERHADGGNRIRPPRPLGMLPGMPWEPREPTRSVAGSSITLEFLEALERFPGIQKVAASVVELFAKPFTAGDSPLPPDGPDPAGGAWRFAAIGDYGAGTPELGRVAANIARSAAELVVTTGDNVYPTGRWIDYQRNWEPYMRQVAGADKAFMPALGNHDMYRDDLRPYFAHNRHLGGRPYYTYTHRNAQFFALDSDQDLRPGSAQWTWLRRELAASKSRWKVVYLHYPMYGRSLKAYSEIRRAVQPLLEEFGVQLVLAGHEHNYQRSQAINGVMHVLTGGGGQQVFPFVARQPDHIDRRAAAFHHVEVAVGRDEMVVRAIDEHGKRIDTARIPWRGPEQAREGVAELRATPRRHHVQPRPADVDAGRRMDARGRR